MQRMTNKLQAQARPLKPGKQHTPASGANSSYIYTVPKWRTLGGNTSYGPIGGSGRPAGLAVQGPGCSLSWMRFIDGARHRGAAG
jgi:hypothetical protein